MARLGFRVQNVTPEVADIDIFDVIGDPFGGTDAASFIKDLRGITAKRINLHINSPGGLVNDGIAIFNALQQHPAHVTALIESRADSAASFVAMAADHRVIFKNAAMHVHDAHGLAIGNAADFRTLADELDEESMNIAQMYADRSGGSAEDWRKAMRANDGIGTTYRGQEAVDAGLADEVAATPAKNVQTMKAVAQTTSNPLDGLEIPALAEFAGYRPPIPNLAGLLEKHPLKVAGK